MEVSNSKRVIFQILSILAFAIVCLSYIQEFVGNISYFGSFSDFSSYIFYFVFIFSSVALIVLITKKSSLKKIGMLLVLLATYRLVDSIGTVIRLLQRDFSIDSIIFFSQPLKTIMCVILICICFFPKKILPYLQILLGILFSLDICLSLYISSLHTIFYERLLFSLSTKYITPVSYFFLGFYLILDPEVKISRPLRSSSTNTILEQGERTMKYCSHCGKEIMSEAVICPHCGCATGMSVPGISSEADVPSPGLNILSFFFPLIGLILFIVYHGKTPMKANSIGKWALIGFLVGTCLSAILYFLMLASL